jgi:hypothetical protein
MFQPYMPNFSGFCEEGPVNRSQMNIKRRTCDIRIWNKKKLFLDISSTNIDTLVPSLYQCVETLSVEAFDCCLRHFHTSVSNSSSSAKRFSPSCLPLYATNTSYRKQEIFLYEYHLHSVYLPTKSAQQNASLRWHTPQAPSSF